MAKTIQKAIVTNQLTLTTGIIASVVMWTVCYIVRPIANFGETIGAFALYALIGYLLIVMNKSFAIIRLRASFQTVIFLILTAITIEIHMFNVGIIMTLCCLFSILLLYKTFHVSWSAGLLFHAFIFWGIASLLVPKIVWLIPYIWYTCYVFGSLNTRSFVASVFGWSIPIGGYALYGYLTNQRMDIMAKAAEIIRVESISSVSIELSIIVMLFFSLLIFLVSAIHFLMFAMDEKVQTRCYLQHLTVTVTVLFIIVFSCISTTLQFMPLILSGVSLLYGHFSTLTNSKWSNIFFVSTLLCLIPLLFINLLY